MKRPPKIAGLPSRRHGSTWGVRYASALAVGVVLGACGDAVAEIEGVYIVEGSRAETAEPYAGRVTVELIGDKYTVTWTLDEGERAGVGLGGAFFEGSFMVGPAHPDDLMITIGFSDGNQTGTATMFLQDTGNYEGFYVTSGSEFAGFEIWTPEETQ